MGAVHFLPNARGQGVTAQGAKIIKHITAAPLAAVDAEIRAGPVLSESFDTVAQDTGQRQIVMPAQISLPAIVSVPVRVIRRIIADVDVEIGVLAKGEIGFGFVAEVLMYGGKPRFGALPLGLGGPVETVGAEWPVAVCEEKAGGAEARLESAERT